MDNTPNRKKRVLDADQRAKNRLIVKRCYYKKLNTLTELRDQVNALETEYERLLEVHHRQHAEPTRIVQSSESESSRSSLHRAYVQLTQMRSALAKENAELKRLGAVHSTMEKQVEQLAAAQYKALVDANMALEFRRANPTLVVNPLTLEQCSEIARGAYREVMAFRESKACFSSGIKVFGWRDRHKVYPDKLMFSLEKVFEGRTVEEVSRGTWEVLSRPDVIARVCPRDMKPHFHVMQHLDENAVIYYHTLEREGTDVRVRVFILAMRVDLGPDGCMVFYRGLDPKVYLRHEGELTARDPRGRKKVEPHKENVWMDAFIWGIFEHVGDQQSSCKNEFGGMIEGTAVATSRWWCLEILQIAMRIEAEVIGPQARLVQ